MTGPRIEYKTVGIEMVESEANWVRLNWGDHGVIVAARKLDGPVVVVRMDNESGDEIESFDFDDHDDEEEGDKNREVTWTVKRLELLLTEIEADELMLIDSGKQSNCKPVLLTKERGEIVSWKRVRDRRFTRGWRWERDEQFYPNDEVFVFLNGENGDVVVKNRGEI